jgi:hypothetical protein
MIIILTDPAKQGANSATSTIIKGQQSTVPCFNGFLGQKYLIPLTLLAVYLASSH